MKKIAPIIITIFAVAYLGVSGYILLFVDSEDNWSVKLLLVIIGIVVFGILIAMIYTLRQRLKEIDKEEDDDFSKYWVY